MYSQLMWNLDGDISLSLVLVAKIVFGIIFIFQSSLCHYIHPGISPFMILDEVCQFQYQC